MTDKTNPRLTRAIAALENLKAKQITTLDVVGLSSIADYMVIASGTSSRHLKSLADHVVEAFKASGELPIGVEGQDGGEWVLVDLGDILVHIMLPGTREYYDLERLWQVTPGGPRPSQSQADH